MDCAWWFRHHELELDELFARAERIEEELQEATAELRSWLRSVEERLPRTEGDDELRPETLPVVPMQVTWGTGAETVCAEEALGLWPTAEGGE